VETVKLKHNETWNSDFIKHTVIKNVRSLKELIVNSTTPIIIVSDGGVHNYDGTFGQVISDRVRQLVHNKGKLYTVDFFESSFRSVIYAMSAGLHTLEAICQEIGEISGNRRCIKLFSDNNRVIQRMHNRRRNKRTVNQHRDSDVDLEIQLLHEIKKWKKIIYSIHITCP
jgi:hypothetical protein